MTKPNSPTPLYHRVYAVMRERIVNGYYPDNVPVPSEAELSGSFGVSRITVRKAMEMLSAEGLITRMRGRGTCVTDRAQKSALDRAVVSNIDGLFSDLNTVDWAGACLRCSRATSSTTPPGRTSRTRC